MLSCRHVISLLQWLFTILYFWMEHQRTNGTPTTAQYKAVEDEHDRLNYELVSSLFIPAVKCSYILVGSLTSIIAT